MIPDRPGRIGRFLPLFLSILCLVRCAGPVAVRPPIPPGSYEVLLERVGKHAARLRTFEGFGRTMMVSRDGGFRGTMRIAARLPDSLWMKIEGPFGVDALRARFGGGHVEMYYPRDHVAYTGTLDAMQSYGFIPMDLGESDLILAMLGLFVSGYTDGVKSLVSDRGRTSMGMHGGDSLCVELRGPVVSFWNRRDTTGADVWRWEGRDFRKRGGVLLPHLVRMTQHRPAQRVTLFYERVRANRALNVGWFDPTIPEGVETIAL